MSKKPEKKPKNPESKYLWDNYMKDDNNNALAVRTDINASTLHNIFFKHVDPFRTSHYMMRICADKGISMESFLTQKLTKYDRDKEINQWKERTFKAERINVEKDKEIAALKKKMKALLK